MMKELLDKYPYFAYAALEGLRQADSPEERERLKAILAANVSSESDLREILGLNSESLVDFYPDALSPTLSTNDTIDVFLDRFGAKEEAIAPVSAPAFDYASTLLPPDDGTPLPDLGLPAGSPFLTPDTPAARTTADAEPRTTVDAADAKNRVPTIQEPGTRNPEPRTQNPEPRTQNPEPRTQNPESEGLTESFAKILIKNRNYTKALEIIEQLNLKNPEKSIYFADQIRFLKKLIITQSKTSAARS